MSPAGLPPGQFLLRLSGPAPPGLPPATTRPPNCAVDEAKELICELCHLLYTQDHVSGTGGGISIKVGDRIVMAPSGVQKERSESKRGLRTFVQ